MATCIECEEEYNDKRLALGYRTCLDCGDRSARRVIRTRTAANLAAMTPNHFDGKVEDLFDERRD